MPSFPFPVPWHYVTIFPRISFDSSLRHQVSKFFEKRIFLCPLFPAMDLTKAFLNCLLALFLWDHTEHFPWDLTSSLSPPCLQANRLMYLMTFCISASFLNSFLWWSSSLFPLSHAVLALDRALGPCKTSEWGLWDRRQVWATAEASKTWVYWQHKEKIRNPLRSLKLEDVQVSEA